MSSMIQHTVFFKFPSIANEVPAEVSDIVSKFNALPGIVAQICPHGVGIEGCTSKADFLGSVEWPDKTDDYTHCLLIIATDSASLKHYLHSPEHLQEWMAAVKPYMQGIVVFDNIIEAPAKSALVAGSIQHTVFFKFPTIATEIPSSMVEVIDKFNALPGIAAQICPHSVGVEGCTSKADFLGSVEWPDKTDDYTHCLLIIATDSASLKHYLHSPEHLQEWMAAVKPYVQGIVVFDNIVSTKFAADLQALDTSRVASTQAEEPQNIVHDVTPVVPQFVTGDFTPTKIFLEDAEYGRALDALVKACSDILVVSSDGASVLLGQRKVEPQPDWWFIGGRAKPGDTTREVSF